MAVGAQPAVPGNARPAVRWQNAESVIWDQ
jgi:hypothetical protein